MNLFEDKLKEIRKDWGLLREYPDLPAGSEMPQASVPQGEPPSVGEENPGGLGEEYNIPIRLGYGAYQVFQQYWMGQGDPLYALLSRRDDSVDIVTVEASEEEIERLEQVAQEIIEANEDPNHVRVAQGVLQDISALEAAMGKEIYGPSDVANGTPPEEGPRPRFEDKLKSIRKDWGLLREYPDPEMPQASVPQGESPPSEVPSNKALVIFDRDALDRFVVVRGATSEQEAIDAARSIYPDIPDMAEMEPGAEWDMIDAEIIDI